MTITLIILGFCSLIWQIVSLRELQATFQGNELSLGIILFCWLAGSAIGGFLSRFFLSQRHKMASPQQLIRPLSCLLLFNSFACFVSLFLSRSLKLFLGISPFEILQPIGILAISCLTVIPQTISMGISFILACAIIRNPLKAYYLEAGGAFLAGILSLAAIKYFDNTQIIWFLSLSFLYGAIRMNQEISNFKTLPMPGLFLALIFLLLPFSGLLTKFQNYTNGLRFKPQQLAASFNSIYANISITRNNGRYALYENGKLSFSTEDTEAIEEFAHMILLHHPKPGKILLIGGGASGLLTEILKHPVESLDYLEPDAKLIPSVLRYIPQAAGYGLADKKVSLYHQDGRSFIKTTGNVYDMVILNTGDPSSLQQNRFYTLEFFQEIKRILSATGQLSIAFSSKEDILTGQMLAYNASLYKTAKAVFKENTVIPGERLILLCSPGHIKKMMAEELIKAFKERNIATQYFSPEYIRAKLFRQEYIQGKLMDMQNAVAINHDYAPYGFFYYLGIWGKQSWLNFNRIWQATNNRIHLSSWLALILLLNFSFRKNPAKMAIFTSGFSGIALEIIISFIFQINFGFLYYRLGAIVASFMLGLSLGSLCSLHLLKRNIHWVKALCSIECALGIASILICMTLRQNQLMYFAATLLVGFLIGLEFGLFYSKLPTIAVYTADLTGACIGSLFIGLIVIPVLGIPKTCAGIALTKFIGLPFLRRQAR